MNSVRIYGVLFTLIAMVAATALLYGLVIRSQADSANQTAAILNAAPIIDTVITAIASTSTDQPSVSLTKAATKRVYVRGVAIDNNGCNDIDTASQWSYRTYRTTIGSACTADNNDCYPGSLMNLSLTNCTGAGDFNLDYEGYVDLQFYADATDSGSAYPTDNWTWSVTIQDESANAGSTATDTYEVNSLIALDVATSISYGALALGADSAVQTATITQAGNRSFDMNRSVDGDMVCNGQGSQNIAAGQVKRHLTDGAFAWTDVAASALSTIATEDELTMGRQINDEVVLTKPYYLRLRVPTEGVHGSCTNTLTMTTTIDENP